MILLILAKIWPLIVGLLGIGGVYLTGRAHGKKAEQTAQVKQRLAATNAKLQAVETVKGQTDASLVADLTSKP